MFAQRSFTYNAPRCWNTLADGIQGRSQKFVFGGYKFLLHNTTVLYTSRLTLSAAISAQNNFQGLILGGYIYRYTPRRYAPDGISGNLNITSLTFK